MISEGVIEECPFLPLQGRLFSVLKRNSAESTEAEFCGEASDPRPVVPEQVCQVRSIQDDDRGTGADPSSLWAFTC